MIGKMIPSDNKTIFDVYDVPSSTCPMNVLKTLEMVPVTSMDFFTQLQNILPQLVRQRFLFHNEWTTVLEFTSFPRQGITYEVVEQEMNEEILLKKEIELVGLKKMMKYLLKINAMNKVIFGEEQCSIRKECIHIPINVDVTMLKVDLVAPGLLIIRAPYVITKRHNLLLLQEQLNFLMMTNPIDTINNPINLPLINQLGFQVSQEMIEMTSTINKLVIRDPTRVILPSFVLCPKTSNLKLRLKIALGMSGVNTPNIIVMPNVEKNELIIKTKKTVNTIELCTSPLCNTVNEFERTIRLPTQLKVKEMEMMMQPHGGVVVEIPTNFNRTCEFNIPSGFAPLEL